MAASQSTRYLLLLLLFMCCVSVCCVCVQKKKESKREGGREGRKEEGRQGREGRIDGRSCWMLADKYLDLGMSLFCLSYPSCVCGTRDNLLPNKEIEVD